MVIKEIDSFQLHTIQLKNIEINDYKLGIIYGNRNINGINHHGNICFLGENKIGIKHAMCVKQHLEENYSTSPIIDIITESTGHLELSYFFTELNHILFFNTSSGSTDDIKKGYFIFPSTITQEQRKIIQILANKLRGYQIYICYDLRIENMEEPCSQYDNPKVSAEVLIENFLNYRFREEKIDEPKIKRIPA